MANSRLYIEIENLIRKNLHYTYNKNTSKVYFNLSDSYPHSREISAFKNFSAQIPGDKKYEFKLSCWRLPQTRIYYNELTCADFTLAELSYFNSSIILAKNYNSTVLSFIIDVKKNQKILDIDNNNISGEEIKTAGYDQRLLLLNFDESITDLKKYLNTIIANEREFNPLTNIFSTDINFLKNADYCWANIPWISKSGEMQLSTNINISLKYLLYLCKKEFPFFFGYPEHLKFERSINKSSFFYLASQHKTNFTSSAKEKIQKFWDIISLPALKFKLIKLIKTNPAEILSFLLVAYRNNFWWSDVASDYIINLTKIYYPEIKPLFRLILLLKSKFNITSGNNNISASTLSPNPVNGANYLKTDSCDIKFIVSKKEIFTSVCFRNKIRISINKEAVFLFDKNIHEVTVCPQTFQYKVESRNICNIILESIRVKIHLIWKDFIINIGDVRIKFLFKKDRYQVSIKGSAKIGNFHINNETFDFTQSHYYKTYYYPEKSEPDCKTYFFNTLGRSVKVSDLKFYGSVQVHTIILDRYGQMLNRIHMQRERTNKNTVLQTLNFIPDKIETNHSFYFIIPKWKSIHFEPGNNESVLMKLLHMDSGLLEKELIIFTADNNIKTIRDNFYNVFGFNVSMNMVDQIPIVFGSVNIVIGESSDVRILQKYPLYKEAILNRKGMKMALTFSKDNFNEWLKSYSV